MTSQSQAGDFCLECRWEDLHIDNNESLGHSSDLSRLQWNCTDQEHHTSFAPAQVNDPCCDLDECSVDCQSVCDGFPDCDDSVACSAAHCDKLDCDEDPCEEDHCDSTDSLCLEDHCCDTIVTQDCGFEAFFGLTTPLSSDPTGMLPSAAMAHEPYVEQGKPEYTLPAMIDPCYHESFLSSYQEHSSHCDQNVTNHFDCHDFQKDLQGMFGNQNYSTPTEVNPSDVFQMLGTCPDFSVCHESHLPDPQLFSNAIEKPKTDPAVDALNCLHPEHHHVHDHDHFKNPNDLNLNISRGVHRSHHRCRTHHHGHMHYSPYSRQARSSVSSHFLSSPRDTPPPLEGGSSSIMTTPDFSTDDNELHVCKWTSRIHGIKTPCGATFANAGALQEHLVANHMNTVDGARGNGYYCCWAGCHRPDEPFSQKSKLQGHFLTHSDYKNFSCSVCGKSFARQATLDRHERSHRGDKPYKCKDCGKAFTDSSELKTHSRTHTGEKPFRCDWPGCNFQTGDSSNMSSHRLTHGERKHKCLYPGCTKSFTRPDQLKRHQRSTHKDASSTLPSPSPSADHFTLPYTLA